MDFEFDFTCSKAMKKKVPCVPGAPVSARVSQILITALYIDSLTPQNLNGKSSNMKNSMLDILDMI